MFTGFATGVFEEVLELNTIYQGDVLEQLQSFPDECIQCVVTSPPFWNLRDYGVDGQIGLEDTPEEYVDTMVSVFQEVKRVLRKDGTVWLNLGDSYSAGKMTPHTGAARNGRDMSAMSGIIRTYNKPKNLVGIPWRVAFALQADNWYLRQDIIWHKPNPMPESVTDRCTKSHEYIFLLTKSAKYFYDADAIREPLQSGPSDIKKMIENKDRIDAKHLKDDYPLHKANTRSKIGRKRAVGTMNQEGLLGRNRRSIWKINTTPYPEAHFAVFPEKLPELCIKAGSREGDTILDPFFGAGTTGFMAQRLGRKWIGIELSEDYIKIAEKRLAQREIFA